MKNETARPNAKKTREEIALFTMINCQMVKIKTSLEFRRSSNCLTLGTESEVDLMKIFSLDSVQTFFFSFSHHLPFPLPSRTSGCLDAKVFSKQSVKKNCQSKQASKEQQESTTRQQCLKAIQVFHLMERLSFSMRNTEKS